MSSLCSSRRAPAEEGATDAAGDAVVVGRRREVDLGCTALGHEGMVRDQSKGVKDLDVFYIPRPRGLDPLHRYGPPDLSSGCRRRRQ